MLSVAREPEKLHKNFQLFSQCPNSKLKIANASYSFEVVGGRHFQFSERKFMWRVFVASFTSQDMKTVYIHNASYYAVHASST